MIQVSITKKLNNFNQIEYFSKNLKNTIIKISNSKFSYTVHCTTLQKIKISNNYCLTWILLLTVCAAMQSRLLSVLFKIYKSIYIEIEKIIIRTYKKNSSMFCSLFELKYACKSFF